MAERRAVLSFHIPPVTEYRLETDDRDNYFLIGPYHLDGREESSAETKTLNTDWLLIALMFSIAHIYREHFLNRERD